MGYIRVLQKHITRKPFLFFVGFSVVFAVVFLVGRRAFVTAPAQPVGDIAPKVVETFDISDAVQTQLSGKVEKEGVTTLISRVGGVVHKVYVNNGDAVRRGQRVAYISDTYTGANRADVAYRISEESVKNSDRTYEKKMGIIDDRRDDVNKTGSLASEIARKQYTIQKRDMELSREVTLLQKKNAAITASLYRPVSPFTGVVDYVFVARGDTIAPGDRIATINANDKTVTISVDLSATLASVIDVSRPSTVSLSGRDISLLPTHLSRDVADDQSYVLTFTVPEEYSDLCNHNEYVSLSVPLEATQHDHNRILVPVDAVRLMNNKTVIFIADGDKARAVEVARGSVVGSLIFVTGDFPRDKKIIVSRNVYDGDHIMVDAK